MPFNLESDPVVSIGARIALSMNTDGENRNDIADERNAGLRDAQDGVL